MTGAEPIRRARPGGPFEESQPDVLSDRPADQDLIAKLLLVDVAWRLLAATSPDRLASWKRGTRRGRARERISSVLRSAPPSIRSCLK